MNRHFANCNLSIHPRNWPDSVLDALKWRERRKLNTSAHPSPAVKAGKQAAIAEHLERHPNDSASKAHLSALSAA